MSALKPENFDCTKGSDAKCKEGVFASSKLCCGAITVTKEGDVSKMDAVVKASLIDLMGYP